MNGVLGRKAIQWVDTEDNVLREFYVKDRNTAYISLSYRTQASVRARARRLGLSAKRGSVSHASSTNTGHDSSVLASGLGEGGSHIDGVGCDLGAIDVLAHRQPERVNGAIPLPSSVATPEANRITRRELPRFLFGFVVQFGLSGVSAS